MQSSGSSSGSSYKAATPGVNNHSVPRLHVGRHCQPGTALQRALLVRAGRTVALCIGIRITHSQFQCGGQFTCITCRQPQIISGVHASLCGSSWAARAPCACTLPAARAAEWLPVLRKADSDPHIRRQEGYSIAKEVLWHSCLLICLGAHELQMPICMRMPAPVMHAM